MAEFILNAEVRNKTGKGDAKKLRAKGRVPAVMYGKDVTPVHLSLDAIQITKTLKNANRNSILQLKFKNGETKEVILRDNQKHPLLHSFSHMDFQALQMDKPVKVDVDINFVGSPVGKKMGGIFTALCKQIKIECLPREIPEVINLNIDNLEAGSSYHVSDVKVGNYKIITNSKIALCQVSKVKEDAEETAEDKPAASTTP